MAKLSAGLLLFQHAREIGVSVLLVHPGGPFWASRDDGAWSIPKGEYASGDDPLRAAEREFAEELGKKAPGGPRVPLGQVKQPGGKLVTAWGVLGDFDVSDIESNTFQIEWPPRSGKTSTFPEVDRASWFDLWTARMKISRGQLPFIEVLVAHLQ